MYYWTGLLLPLLLFPACDAPEASNQVAENPPPVALIIDADTANEVDDLFALKIGVYTSIAARKMETAYWKSLRKSFILR